MKCPKCNETAISFLRYISTSKGVGWKMALRGHLVCQRCASSLKVRTFGRLFWVYITLLVLFLLVETYFFRKLIPQLEQEVIAVIFLVSVLAIAILSGFLEWKYAELEETPPQDTK